MTHLKISLRNLMRNYRRTLLTMTILILGVCGMLTYAGYSDFSMWGLRENTINNGLGHIQIFKKGYNKRGNKKYLNYLIDNHKQVFKKLMRLPYVREATSELSLKGLLASNNSTEMTLSRGYDLQWISTIKNSFEIKKGEFLKPGNKYQIALGSILAEKLNVGIGDNLTLMTNTKDGALNASDVTVTTIINTGIKQYDEVLSIIPIELSMELLDVNAVEKFIVMLEKTGHTDMVNSRLADLTKNQILNIESKTWIELADFYHKVKTLYESNITITQIIILFIVVFSIINTMRMIIMERMREIGTIRAIGMTKVQIIKMFIYESVWLGILGITGGIIVSEIVAFVINITGGIYIPPPPTSTDGYYAMIQPELYRYFEAAFVVFISVIIGALIPAFKAAKIKIDEALRYI